MSTNSTNACASCCKTVRNNQRGIYCELCKRWLHLSCTSFTVDDYLLMSNSLDDWYCHFCLASLLPFNNICDDLEFKNLIFNLDHSNNFSLDYLHNSCQFSIISNKLGNDSDFDPDSNCIRQNCKDSPYYLDTELNELIVNKSLTDLNFSILHINAQSLHNKIGKLLDLMNNIKIKFTVIAVSETWSNDTNECFLNIPGYKRHLKSRVNRTGGGVALFVQDNLSFTVRKDLDNIMPDYVDTAFVDVIEGRNSKFTVGVVYRPPDGELSIFNDCYFKLLDKLSGCKSKCYIAGDFNINLLNCDKHMETETFLNGLFSHHYFPTITRPTRFCSTASTLIDNIFFNNPSIDSHSGIIISDLSDHLPIFFISGNKLTSKRNNFIVNSYRDESNYFNLINFKDKLAKYDWHINLTSSNANTAYNDFMLSFSSLYNECFPIIHKKVKLLNYSKPWITPAILKSTKRKNYLYKNWLIKKTEYSLNKYKNYKNKLTGLIRYAEKSYYENQFTGLKDNIKGTWRLIKNIISNTGKITCTNNIDELLINGKITNDKFQMANKFNEYFVKVGSELASKIPSVSGDFRKYINNAQTSIESIFVQPTDPTEIANIVNNFKSNKSPGFDDIRPSVVKNIIQTIAQPLADIFNLSLSTGIFPDNMKTAKVVPIFKCDNKRLVNNYRPISVLPVFSKILEKIMYNRLISFMEKNKYLTDNQYGFRANYSTSMALIELIDRITEEMDDKKFSLGIFIDLSKAFDTVNHKILLEKLHLYGIRGNAFDWFSNYLSNRHQFVQLSNTKSTTLPINCGVPQGSILGPLLFIIYINDITNVSKLAIPIMFADDTNLFFSDCNLTNLVNMANDELDKISLWFKLNKLSLNVKKTNFILFRSHNSPHHLNIDLNIDIKIDNMKIEQVHSTKFLGVIINQTLSWKEHIYLIKQKINKNVGIIRKISKSVPQSVLLSLYHTLIHPYLAYCNIVWAIDRTTFLDKLFVSQKKAIRLIANSKFNSHTAPLFLKLSILTIYQLNDLQVGCFVYRCTRNTLPNKFCSMFNMNSSIHSHQTRQCSKLHHEHCRLHVRSKTIRNYGVLLWNSLTDDICYVNSFASFKCKLKYFLLNKR